MQGKVELCGVNTAELPVLKSAETRAAAAGRGGGVRSPGEADLWEPLVCHDTRPVRRGFML